MAMQGKSTSSDTPSLDVAEAEQAASAFRPAWGDEAWEIPPTSTDIAAPTAAPIEAAAIVATPVIALGEADTRESTATETKPAPPAPPKPTTKTQLGLISPEVAAIAAAANAANAKRGPSASEMMTLVGMSLDAAGATTTASAAEALTSDAIIEVVPAVSAAATIEPSRSTFPSSAPAPPTKSPPATTIEKTADAPFPLTSADPFPSVVPAAEPSVDDLALATKRPSKNLLYAGIGGVALIAMGLLVKLASPSDTAAPDPAPTALKPAAPSPTNDIPPPPPKDEEATEAVPAVKGTEAPTRAATEAPAAKTHDVPTHATPTATAKAHEPPRATTSTAAARSPDAPRATTPAAPKAPPKSTGGGIVRDSPF